jgi:CubicO group peptidase (beta-lactamase class C family)
MPRERVLLLLLLVLPAPLAAQARHTPPAFAAAVDAYVAPLQALHVFSGVVLVGRGDSVIFRKAYGVADVEHGVPLTPASVFRVASLTKSFTRVLAGVLAERGVLELDAPIARWLPDFPAAEALTMRMLLDHRAGVPNVNSLPYDEEALAQGSLPALVEAIARLPLDFAPGSARRYSNGGYAVATRVLELAGGGDYATLLRAEVLDPVGLAHTRHEADSDVVPGRARGYAPSPVAFGRTVHAAFQEMATKTGGGSLVSTADDLHRWALALGAHPVLSPRSWAELFPAGDTWTMTGRSPGYNAALLREDGIVVVVLANSYAAGMTYDVAAALAGLAAGRPMPPLAVAAPQPPATPETAAALTGSYLLPPDYLGIGDDTVLEIRPVGGGLVAFVNATPFDVLVPQPGGRFLLRSLWSMLAVADTADGPVRRVEIRPLYRDVVFSAPRVPERQP